ncbi:LuxR C-terminal-related transcriptional regulator [Fusibacter sp. 3D3]|uniref:helix-turn-helix transcriptional regulator n=1 Tax=Fusibacter sp. 3D3 TaxID=1048380 RepID=UPI00085317D6|nr:LuxR C-terminal-related transcriptional regulator [Fusibacter sp. 3D3]GAU78476.1 ATP-dependent transcriptional regulator-like protein [Fusibacter sp. 3D3]
MLEKNLLQRKNISKALANALDYPLTLLIAPMGYGKTTATIEFFKTADKTPYWFHFEADEHSPKFIWDTFSRQIKMIDEALGELFRNLGFPFLTPQRNEVFSILQAITKTKPIHIIIDDYQFNKSTTFDEFIELLVRADIYNLHLLILSRSMPNLKIEELKLKNKCCCITQKSFLLSSADVGKLFRINHIPAGKDIILKVHEQAEGWISVALLLMHKYQETGQVGSVEPIETLIESTLMTKHQNELEIIALLGILDSFSMSQLASILGQNTAALLINKLQKTGTFLRYHSESKRYTIHHIFQTYLYEYEFQRLPQALQRTYYAKTGLWLVENNFIIEGIKCLTKAEEYVQILKAFEKGSIRKMYDHDPDAIIHIMEQMPQKLKFEHLLAYLCYLHFLISSHDIPHGARLLHELDAKVKNDEINFDCTGLKIEGEIEFLKSLMAYNDIETIFARQKKAYAILGGSSKTTKLDKMPCSGSFSVLYLYYKQENTFKQTAESIQDNIKYYELLANRKGTGLKYAVMAEYFLEIGHIEQAELYAQKAIIKAEKLPQFDALICGTFTLSRCAIAKGQIDKANELMNRLTAERSPKTTSLFYSSRSPYFLAMDALRLKTGQFEVLSEPLKNNELSAHLFFFQSKGLGFILYGQYLLHEGKYIELELLCEEMNTLFSEFNNLMGYIHAYILEAIAMAQIYNLNQAMIPFKKAIAICKGDHIITSFAEYGIWICPLLEHFITIEGETPFLKELLLKSLQYAEILKKCRHQNMPLRLTSRELEIMALLKTGKSNIQMGTELFISESAVKKLLSSIYSKLGAKNRTQAIKLYNDQLEEYTDMRS